ncbi:cytochrome P450 [Trametes meyenii]|nr:cytochrome P450 [Trametes meyenii]
MSFMVKAMDIAPFNAVLLCAGVYISYSILHWLFVKHPLENIPGPKPTSWLYGNLKQLLSMNAWDVHRQLVEEYPGVVGIRGLFGAKMLYVYDPTALHTVLVKDQNIFEETRFFIKSHKLVLGPGLVASLGESHRRQRKLLNPVFSTTHMRDILPILYHVAGQLQIAIESRVCAGQTEIDMVDWMGRVALEFIGQAGLGYSFDPLVEDKSDKYATALKAFSYAMADSAFLRRLLPYLPTLSWGGIGHAIAKMVPHKGTQRLVSVVDMMHERSIAILEEKRRALSQGDAVVSHQVGQGKDIMSVLLRANLEAAAEDKLPEEEIIGQMSTMIIAAMDTTSNMLVMILCRLSEFPECQKKLREEIVAAGADNPDTSYDTLMNLPYLDAVIRETLRLHAPVSQVFRETRKDAVLPLSEPIRGKDGSTVHEIFVPKDTQIIVGLMNANRNKAVWGEDAMEWNPERWLSPLPESLTDAKIPGVYSNIMTFLGGARSCIGFKFSILEMKAVLSLLLPKFVFEQSGAPVCWNSAAVLYPSVGGYGGKASLPMKLRLVGGEGRPAAK